MRIININTSGGCEKQSEVERAYQFDLWDIVKDLWV